MPIGEASSLPSLLRGEANSARLQNSRGVRDPCVDLPVICGFVVGQLVVAVPEGELVVEVDYASRNSQYVERFWALTIAGLG